MQKKGLNAICADIEYLELPEKSFDGVWAYACLLHFPKKKIPDLIEKIKYILKPSGLLGIALKEGVSEGFEKYKDDTKRWFSYFNEDEIKNLFEKHFEFMYFFKKKTVGDKYTFLDYIMRLK